MGNSGSVIKEDQGELNTVESTRKQLTNAFRKYVKTLYNNVELITISHFFFGKVVGLNTSITYDAMLEQLNFNCLANTELYEPLYKFLKRVSQWPNISQQLEGNDKTFTLGDIIVIIFFLNKNGLEKLGLNETNYIYSFYLSTFLSDNWCKYDSENVDIIVNQTNDIQWHLIPIVRSFDYIELSEFDGKRIELMLQLLLPLSIADINKESFSLNYKTQIKSLMNSLKLSSEENTLNLQKVIEKVGCFAPRLFNSFENIFLGVMRRDADTENQIVTTANHKILNYQLLSQLASIIPIDSLSGLLQTKTMYQGSNNGFSINSIQSHTLNYNAKTLLLISGKTKSQKDIRSPFFDRFPTFHPVLSSDLKLKENSKFLIAIIIPTPWRITNSKTFGNKDLRIILLSPYQVEFTATEAIKQDYCYFSNIGLGLGFGSQPPLKAKDKKNSNTFRLGGVSLTIDTSLEVGDFRVEDPSKQSSSLLSDRAKQINDIYNDI